MATAEAPFAALPAEEDYIDMELTSSPSSNSFCYSIRSPTPPSPPAASAARDFEFQFQMTSFSDETEAITSPADDLFYKGKLLPLHLPPRLQMVQKLLHSPKSQDPSRKTESFSENFEMPFITIKAPPHESCNVSPSESCRASCELNPDDYLLGFRGEIIKDFVVGRDPPRTKSWSKKVKQLKQSSQAYFKALFGKSACSTSTNNKSSVNSVFNEESQSIFESERSSGKFIKVSKKAPFGRIDYNKWQIPNNALEKEKAEEFYGGILNINNHRRSFSGAIQRTSSSSTNNNSNNNKSSSSCSSCSSTSSSGSSSLSSSFSFSSNGFCDLQSFKRSISSNSERENSIEGAIAHCKQSQKLIDNSKKNESETQPQTCSLSVSKVLPCGDQKSSQLCRI
ncbi:probable membrane-associated kinase regulator 4 [Benincasa hispida]|uniref:probable membrane-associated kinase regulator 4 n=1 Tax=Benincasa hispida TaxID=102211 RepID=UPI0018FF3D71|nr:probable membrane-associated kinase regulator 4 [Benincasa hispida]